MRPAVKKTGLYSSVALTIWVAMMETIKVNRNVTFLIDTLLPFTGIRIVTIINAGIVIFVTNRTAWHRTGAIYRTDHEQTANHKSQNQKLSVKF
jgi:cytochrome c oxidase subunit IV